MEGGVRHPAVDEPVQKQGLLWGELVLGTVLLGLGILVIVDGASQPASKSASGIGAGFFPLVVGAVLIAASLALILQVLRGKRGEPEDEEGDVDATVLHARQAVLVVAAILLFIIALEPAGYIPASAITFWLIAFAMGARRHLRSALIAVVLSAGIYVLFTQLLRIDLPAGFLQGVI